MYTTLLIASLLMLLTTLSPHLPGKHWLVRVWEFPRLQLLVLIILCMTGWSVLTTTYPLTASCMLIALAVAGVYQAAWILPYTILWPKQVAHINTPEDNRTISILTSNVYMHNENHDGLKNLVNEYQPDMLILLESNSAWQEAMSSIHNDYPHRLACPLENLYGMHLYSRIPFKQGQIRYVVEDKVPSMEVQIEIDNTQITVYFLHPKPPSPTENEYAGPRDTELAIIGREMAAHSDPVIVAGDLNDVAWSPSTRRFRKLSNAQDPRIGRGFFNTFHAKYPLVRWPLDHVFHSKDFELVYVTRLAGYGSDHFPLYTKLQLASER